MKTAKNVKIEVRNAAKAERPESFKKDAWTRNRQTVRKMIIDGKEAIVFM